MSGYQYARHLNMSPHERVMADIGLIALRHGLTRHDILSVDKRSKVVDARAECARYFRAQGRTLADIGRILGGRDHSTIHNLLKGKRHPLKRNRYGQFTGNPETANDNSVNASACHCTQPGQAAQA